MSDTTDETILILYGTETFNAEGLAEDTGEALEAAGFTCEVVDMDDFDLSELTAATTLLIVTSTYGNGDPPANAEPLFEYLMGSDAPRLDGLRFSVCGLGDTTYARFSQCGKDFDRRLEELGGRRFVARKDCDVDFEEPWQEWCDAVVAALQAGPGVAGSATPADEPATSEASPAPAAAPPEPGHRVGPRAVADAPLGSRKHPTDATVLDLRRLTRDGATREVLHLSIQLPEGAPEWSAGDSFAFWTPNDPALVEAVLDATQADGDAPVTVRDARLGDETLPLRDALRDRLELTTADARLGALVVESGGALPERPDGAVLHVLDVVAAASQPLAPQALVDSLRHLHPRLYSVASSPRVNPRVVDFTASVVRYSALGRERVGVATGHLAARLKVGDTLRVHHQPAHAFSLAEPDQDIIMIGPGTGIAPFRGFLQERAQTRAPGRSWLVFGSRNRETDFLYEAELDAWRVSGVLTRLDLAWSRDQAEKVYVQDRLREHGSALWTWISGGATVYVCGDAKHMAPDVHRTLQELAQEHGGMDAGEAKAWIKGLARERRYMRDIY